MKRGSAGSAAIPRPQSPTNGRRPTTYRTSTFVMRVSFQVQPTRRQPCPSWRLRCGRATTSWKTSAKGSTSGRPEDGGTCEHLPAAVDLVFRSDGDRVGRMGSFVEDGL